MSVADFNEHTPLVSTRLLDGKVLQQRPKSMKDIAAQWRQLQEEGRGQRAKSSRTFEVTVAGVGKVQVLKQNDYTLEDGEPSVFAREAAGYSSKGAGGGGGGGGVGGGTRQAAGASKKKRKTEGAYVIQSGRQVAGRDYDNEDYCQVDRLLSSCTISHTCLSVCAYSHTFLL